MLFLRLYTSLYKIHLDISHVWAYNLAIMLEESNQYDIIL